MNKVFLIGRLTSDPELRENDKYKQCKFTLAVNRIKDGADFINCIAWGNTAELISKYFNKGSQLALEGHINTGSYEKDGKKIYTTDITVENITFIGSKEKATPENKGNESIKMDDIDYNELLPF